MLNISDGPCTISVNGAPAIVSKITQTAANEATRHPVFGGETISFGAGSYDFALEMPRLGNATPLHAAHLLSVSTKTPTFFMITDLVSGAVDTTYAIRSGKTVTRDPSGGTTESWNYICVKPVEG